MKLDKNALENAKHILVCVDEGAFANASALYTYILTLHKKVSLYAPKKVPKNISYLPWYDKLRDTPSSSAELSVNISLDTKKLYNFFIDNDIKINKKMATALYAGLLQKYEFFKHNDCDDTIFSITSALIGFGAEYQKCNAYFLHKIPLSLFRLKARIFHNMVLRNDAKQLDVYVSSEDLQASGATLEDANLVMKELLSLVHTQKLVLYKSDEENKILTTMKKEKFEK